MGPRHTRGITITITIAITITMHHSELAKYHECPIGIGIPIWVDIYGGDTKGEFLQVLPLMNETRRQTFLRGLDWGSKILDAGVRTLSSCCMSQECAFVINNGLALPQTLRNQCLISETTPSCQGSEPSLPTPLFHTRPPPQSRSSGTGPNAAQTRFTALALAPPPALPCDQLKQKSRTNVPRCVPHSRPSASPWDGVGPDLSARS